MSNVAPYGRDLDVRPRLGRDHHRRNKVMPLGRLVAAAIAVRTALFLCFGMLVQGQRQLLWEDNFDGDSLNGTVWNVTTGNGCDQGEELCGWGNSEQQTYTLDNHRVADGVLNITAKRSEVEIDERWYTSSRIRSQAPVAFLTGRIEARIWVPRGLGLWAAFWMLPANESRGVWAESGEIDIMEEKSLVAHLTGNFMYDATNFASRIRMIFVSGRKRLTRFKLRRTLEPRFPRSVLKALELQSKIIEELPSPRNRLTQLSRLVTIELKTLNQEPLKHSIGYQAVNEMDEILGTIHYGGAYPNNRFAGCAQSSGIDFSDDYHLYSLEWEGEEMRWYVDDQLFCLRTKWSSDLESIPPYRAPFDAEFELLLNLAVGGSLPGPEIDDDIFPASMLVDYVRVYNISTEAAQAQPYLGAPVCLPGLIEAEAFDTGGVGLGYGQIQSPDDEVVTYRMDGAGLVYAAGGRTFIANLTDGDWTAYTVQSGGAVYDITLEVSTAEAAALEILLGAGSSCTAPGNDSLTGSVAVNPTGENVWGFTTINSVQIPQGTHNLKLCVTGGIGLDIDTITLYTINATGSSDSMTLTADDCATTGVGRPFMFGKPWAIPGYLEAEFYDYGGPGVGFSETTSLSDWASMLRWPDRVDVIEAESNPANGQYVGHWESGEWLAFTSRAEAAGYWDVGASVASGSNGSTIEFRVLVNATNCSSLETDGFEGLGTDGIDLLDGPVTHAATGSWEAFVLASREDVWVPEGDHRILFCADSGMFNFNYLWFFTPNPTPVPTPVPSPAPTTAPPVVAADTGTDYKWIYVSVAVFVGLAAFSRLGWIIYRKERSRRMKSGGHNDLNSVDTPRDDDETTGPLKKGSPMRADEETSSRGQGRASLRGLALELLSVEPTRRTERQRDGDDANNSGANGAAGKELAHEDPVHRRDRMSGRVSRAASSEDLNSRILPHPHAFVTRNGSVAARQRLSGTLSSTFRSTPGDYTTSEHLSWRKQPLVSPVESAFSTSAAGTATVVAAKTPRAAAGMEVDEGGSLWDRSAAMSPLQRPHKSATLTTSSRPKRDQFEDALIRALDDKFELTTGKVRQSLPRPAIMRAHSLSEDVPTRNAMLAAVKCWTCVCGFENSDGQEACLGCSRVAPIRRNSGSVATTPSRRRLPPHRMHSYIPPPSDD